MELSQNEKKKLLSYLLGQLPEPEQLAIEESVFADQVKFYQLCEIEDELLARHAHGELHGVELTQFEQQYLAHPARRARVEFAQTLATEFTPKEIAVASQWQTFLARLRQPYPVWATATAALLLIGVTTWWLVPRTVSPPLIGNNSTPSPSPVMIAGASSPSPTASSLPTPQARVTLLPQPVVAPATITLTAITLRGEPRPVTETLRIAPEQTNAQIRVKLPDQDYAAYEVRLQTAVGQPVKSWTVKPRTTSEGQLLTLSLPTRQLFAGDYLLVLEARIISGAKEPIAKLLFKVVKL